MEAEGEETCRVPAPGPCAGRGTEESVDEGGARAGAEGPAHGGSARPDLVGEEGEEEPAGGDAGGGRDGRRRVRAQRPREAIRRIASVRVGATGVGGAPDQGGQEARDQGDEDGAPQVRPPG
jgi:hypothetical protein